MTRKHIYIVLLICCLGMLSSANQNSSDAKKVVCNIAETKKDCCLKTAVCPAATETNKLAIQPLNLLLFEL